MYLNLITQIATKVQAISCPIAINSTKVLRLNNIAINALIIATTTVEMMGTYKTKINQFCKLSCDYSSNLIEKL